eukprot:4136219-Prymnesium_polylepis.1
MAPRRRVPATKHDRAGHAARTRAVDVLEERARLGEVVRRNVNRELGGHEQLVTRSRAEASRGHARR